MIQYTSEFDLSYSTKDSCGLDLYIAEDYILSDDKYVKLATYTRFDIPSGYFGLLAARSSSALKRGIEVCIGIVDRDYTGYVGIVAKSVSGKVELKKGERIAQIVIVPYCQLPISKISNEEFDNITKNKDRGDRGFGSTGI